MADQRIRTVRDNDLDALFYAALAPAGDQDPAPLYRQLREAAPVLLTAEGVLVLSAFSPCEAALRHPALGKGADLMAFEFTSASSDNLERLLGRVRASMVFSNPPDHTRLRRAVAAAFTTAQVEALGPAVRQRVAGLLAGLRPGVASDFVPEVARRLPLQVIADLLGLPEDDVELFQPWAADFSAVLSAEASADALERAALAETAFVEYLTAWLTDRREHLRDGVLMRLVHSHDEQRLTLEEMVSSAILLFGAGFETTANLLGNGLRLVFEQEGLWERWRSGGVDTVRAVEEMLRCDAPVPVDGRSVLEPVTFAGVDLVPGQTVVTLLAAANRDPGRFKDPDRFDVGREGPGHLSFASGIHYCLGTHLARLEAVTVFSEMVRRFSAVEPAGAPRRRPGLALRGHSSLPVTVRA
ncbi:cytochrome P450 [Streptomyces sp. NPDC005576]|uniref:cytochrome P450 n=1 Tax=Streptomyces sp. NPDC005576 TaxID=3364726 RepID=UPI0036AD9403